MPENIRVLFFGATAAITGSKELVLQIENGAKAVSAVEQLKDRFPELKNHKLLFAVNQEYSPNNYQLKDGDELAIFTPVSGG